MEISQLGDLPFWRSPFLEISQLGDLPFWRSLKPPNAYKNLKYMFDGMPGVQLEKTPTGESVFAPSAKILDFPDE